MDEYNVLLVLVINQDCYISFDQMDARNLAIVFGPTLVRPQDESVALMVKDMSDQCRVVETIITNVGTSYRSFKRELSACMFSYSFTKANCVAKTNFKI